MAVEAYVGLSECAEYDVAGSGPWVSFDKVDSGGLDYEGGEPQHNVGTGGQDIVYRDMVVPIGNATCAVQSLDLINCAKPPSVGALPPVIKFIQGGVVGNVNAARKQSDCYLNTLELSCERGGLFMATYNWMALGQEQVNIAAAAAKKASNLAIAWHTGNVLIADEMFKTQRWTVTVENAITAQTSEDEKATDAERLPEWMDPGDFSVALTVEFRVRASFNFIADWVPTFGFKATGTSQAGQLLTVDLTGGNGLHLAGDPLPIESGADEVLWRVSAEAEHNDLDVFAVSLA